MKRNFILIVAIANCFVAVVACAFEGKIEIVTTKGSETIPLLYTVGGNFLRIEVTGTDWPNPIDIVDLKSGAMTLVFPHNRSFVKLPAPAVAGIAHPGPQSTMPPGIGPQSAMRPGVPAMPQMPMIPPMMDEKIELKATGKKEKILGFDCEQFEIKQRDEMMEIWATDKLPRFQPYVRNQQPRFGSRMLEEQWAELLTAKKLFPLRASLHFDNGPKQTARPERFHFEVKSIKPEKIDNKNLFQPPEGYHEIQPLPF